MKKIIIGADFVSTDENLQNFKDQTLSQVIDPVVYSAIKNADFSVMNLELPLIEKNTPYIKPADDCIGQSKEAIPGYKELNIKLCAMANNHILDNGIEGLKTSLETLDNAGISHIGAGLDLDSARKPYVFTLDGKKIGIYNCCDRQYSACQDYGFGAYVFDPFESLDEIAELKKQVDYLIVLYHGGLEHYRCASPYLQKLCRKMVDVGADLVVVQHTHCVGCEEDYKGAKIIYGQGNALFSLSTIPYYRDHPCWQSGMYVVLELDGDKVSFSYLPCYLKDSKLVLDTSGEIMKGYFDRTEKMKNPEFVKQNYLEFCKEEYKEYLPGLKRFDTFYLLNALQCEQHRELLTTVFRDENDIKTI